jgi:hypothetical protein
MASLQQTSSVACTRQSQSLAVLRRALLEFFLVYCDQHAALYSARGLLSSQWTEAANGSCILLEAHLRTGISVDSSIGKKVVVWSERAKSTSMQGIPVTPEACSCREALEARYATTSLRSTVAVTVSTSYIPAPSLGLVQFKIIR